MQFFKKGILALGIACAGLTASAFATPSPYLEQNAALTESRQTFVLTPGSAGFSQWTGWIRNQNAIMAKRNEATPRSDEPSQITIVISTPYPSNQGRVTAFGDSPPDNGPPMPLPTTGVEGQHITLLSQTATTYQSWIYVWHGTSGGGGGWDSVSYSGNYCDPGLETGKLCARSAL